MPMRSETIDDRLEGLQQEARRVTFGTNLQAFRLDVKSAALSGDRSSKLARKKTENGDTVDQMVGLLEALSRRIDSLEAKDRALGDEIRHRARVDQRRRSLIFIGAILGTTIFAFGCSMNLI